MKISQLLTPVAWKPGPFILAAVALLLVACGPGSPSEAEVERRIAQGVIGTVAALPTGAPLPTPLQPRAAASATADLSGVFCEYHFCIGHPADLPFADANQTASPSTYGQGKVLAFRQDLVILVAWAQTPGGDTLQAALEGVLTAEGDTPAGDSELRSISGREVAYLPIHPPAAATAVPFGASAAWQCGDRIFVWKAYTAQDAVAPGLLNEALARFTCGQ